MATVFEKIICTETGIRKSMKMENIGNYVNYPQKVILKKNVNEAIVFTKKISSPSSEIFIIGSHFLGPYVVKNFKNCFGIVS